MDIVSWYPGHMHKSSKALLEEAKKVDIVIELVDARAPKNTRNDFFKKITKDKPTILIYTKSDLADLTFINKNENRQDFFFFSIKDNKKISDLYFLILFIIKKNNLNILGTMPVVAVVGIPNVGKSSLINAIIHQKKARVENRPGVTKNFQYINVNKKFYLLDTAGILPNKFLKTNYILAMIGAIKIELLPIVDLSDFAYNFIIKKYPNLYIKRYKNIAKNSYEAFKNISDLYNIKNDKSLNFEFARSIFLKDIRDGKLGKLFFEK